MYTFVNISSKLFRISVTTSLVLHHLLITISGFRISLVLFDFVMFATSGHAATTGYFSRSSKRKKNTMSDKDNEILNDNKILNDL